MRTLIHKHNHGFSMKYAFYPTQYFFFFFNDTATTEIYTLSLHDALPIWSRIRQVPLLSPDGHRPEPRVQESRLSRARGDRKSTRLNSSHANISYAVFCLKKKKKSRRESTPLNNNTTIKAACYTYPRRPVD